MGRNRKKSNNKMRIQEFFIVCMFLCITSQLLASETVENEEEEVVKRHWNYHPSHWGSWGRGGHWGHGGRWGGRGRWGGGRWGKRDVESQEIESTNDAGNEVAKDQAKRWYGVGMGYHPYAYSPYGYGYWGKRDVETQATRSKRRYGKRDVEAQQETEKTRRKRDVEGQEIETTEKDENAGQEVTKDQAKRWYGYGYGGYGLGYGGYYRPYGYGYWGKRDVETQATRSKRRYGKRDVEAQQETEKTRRKRDVEGQEIETTEKD